MRNHIGHFGRHMNRCVKPLVYCENAKKKKEDFFPAYFDFIGFFFLEVLQAHCVIDICAMLLSTR